MERESAPDRVGFEDFSPNWQMFAPDVLPGLFFTSGRTDSPRLEFWALRIDLTELSLEFVVNSATRSTKVSSFVRDYALLAGINTVPFYPVSSRDGEARTSTGVVVSAGLVLSPPAHNYDALVFFRDGRARIIPQSKLADLSAVKTAIGGFRIILNDSELPPRLSPSPTAPRHPRSAAGLSADGRTLYLLVIDGRRRASIGATEAETGLILQKLGAASGLNFDGGGSTAMALRFPDGRVRTVNTPIHSGIPGRERAVAACLGLRAVE
ncbi:MAG: phosphodiester glycosidase family protein [Treponema sp.]|nr:phosphodiester glycosidase family protein [Treponema sp.]